MPLEFASGLTVRVVPPTVPVIRVSPPDSTVVVFPVAGPQGPPGLTGPQGAPGTPGGGAQSYSHAQITADELWEISHGLGYRPAGILAKDSIGDIVEPADITYPDLDTIQLLFGRLISGTAEVS